MNTRVALAFAIFFSSGCALIDPTRDSRHSALYKSQFCSTPSGANADLSCSVQADRNSLPKAFDLSVAQQKIYLRASGRHDLARSIAGPTLVAGSAYALLLGISPGIGPANASDQIAAIGTGGAALFGASNFLVSPRRQDVYIAGAKAIACAQERARPFLLPEVSRDLLDAEIQKDPDDATAKSGRLVKRRAILDVLIKRLGGGSQSDPLIKAANELLAESAVTLDRGRSLIAQIDGGAAQALLGTVRSIDLDVASELRKAQPELASILTIVDGIPGVAAKIGGAGFPAAKTATQGGRRLALQEDLREEVVRAMVALQQSVDSVRSVVNSVLHQLESVGQKISSDQSVVVRLGDCILSPIDASLHLDQQQIVFKLKVASNQSLKVEGGEWPFAARLAETIPGVTVSQTPEFGRTVNVNYDGKAAATSAPIALTIQDKTGSRAEAKVAIVADGGVESPPLAARETGVDGVPPEPPKGDVGDTWRADDRRKALFAKLNEVEKTFLRYEDAKAVQRALCLVVRDGATAEDADFGAPGADTRTRNAIRQFHADIGGDIKSDTLTLAEIGYLAGADVPPCAAPALSWYESSIRGAGKLSKILSKIETGATDFNEAVRGTLAGMTDETAAGYENVLTLNRCQAVGFDADACDIAPPDLANGN